MSRALRILALALALPVLGQQGQLPPRLSPEELLRQFDRNGDAKIRRDEAPERLWQRWDQIDPDHDGFIALEELKAHDARVAGVADAVPDSFTVTGVRAMGGEGGGSPGGGGPAFFDSPIGVVQYCSFAGNQAGKEGNDAYTAASSSVSASDPSRPSRTDEPRRGAALRGEGANAGPGWPSGPVERTGANEVIEIPFRSQKPHVNPFLEVTLDVLFTDPRGDQKTVPAFWAGGDQWKVRYAAPVAGTHSYRTHCSDPDDTGLHAIEGRIEIVPYVGRNPLYRHGPIQIAADHRHFAYADGTPFFWLGDTWWKCLCKRMAWDGFQELTADRKAKGFTVVQIVCGPYPDEDPFETMWENEGGKPYRDKEFTRTNPAYFDYADRRLQHLIEAGIVPAIVGCWARADCDSMKFAGVEGLKRHGRQLVARYGAYPVVWIVAGEVAEELRYGKGPWGEVAKHLRKVDPYHRLSTSHVGSGHAEPLIVDFDMVGGSHDASVAAQPQLLAPFHAAYSGHPPVPVLCGETCYEGHMQQGWQDVQRRMFWMFLLSGAAGHTYGAAGVWHAGVEGDPGQASSAFGGRRVYDWTTWKAGMNYPGSTQLGICKRLLEEYPWWRFEPHPEWAEKDCYAAGIPGEVRFIYQPGRGIYNWKGAVARQVETDVDYTAFYFDPATGRRFAQGRVNVVPGGLTGDYLAPDLPSPQDWVLVLERRE